MNSSSSDKKKTYNQQYPSLFLLADDDNDERQHGLFVDAKIQQRQNEKEWTSCCCSGQNDSLLPSNEQRRRQVLTFAAVTQFLPASSAQALSPEQASFDYDVYSKNYNDLDGGVAASALGIDQARTQLLTTARGRVLEIGAGTGLNLDKYRDTISSLTLVDISQGMLDEAQQRAIGLNNLGFKVEFVKADATNNLVQLFGPNAFDTVVDTFSLCVMGNDGSKSALQQMTQVCKSQSNGGRLLLLENTRSRNLFLGLYQDVTADAAAAMGGKGCVYNQDVQALIQQTKSLKIVQQESFALGLFQSFECIKDE